MLFGLAEFGGEEVGAYKQQAEHEVGMNPSLLPEELEGEGEHVH